jgi:hypothetical protein
MAMRHWAWWGADPIDGKILLFYPPPLIDGDAVRPVQAPPPNPPVPKGMAELSGCALYWHPSLFTCNPIKTLAHDRRFQGKSPADADILSRRCESSSRATLQRRKQ